MTVFVDVGERGECTGCAASHSGRRGRRAREEAELAAPVSLPPPVSTPAHLSPLGSHVPELLFGLLQSLSVYE